MFVCKPLCEEADPTTDIVKVDMTSRLIEQERREAEERRRQEEREEAAELERQRAQEAEEERRRVEEEAAKAKEREEAEARRKEVEQARRAEIARRVREADEARHREAARREAEEAQRVEMERVEMERIAQEKRKERVAAFLKEFGFSSVTAPRRKLTKTNYALHKAAKLGDAELVEMLLLEGADAKQKDSRGKTPGQVAQTKNSEGSHQAVIALLGGGSGAQPAVGGA